MILSSAPENTCSVRPIRTFRKILGAVVGISAVAFLIAHAPIAAARHHAVPAPAAGVAHLYDTAQHEFREGSARAGLDALDRAVDIDPGNADVLALRAFWGSQAMDMFAMQDSLNRLGAINPGERTGVLNAISAINTAAATPPDPFPSIQGPQTAIVVLGYGLLPNGAMRPELINRLHAAWVQAVAAPFSPIITTGGNPQNGITEGQAMAAWLIGHGIPAGRIHPETRADSTVQNALFSAEIIRSLGANSAVVVTSANHIRRGTADLDIAGVPVIGETSALDQVICQLRPLTPSEERGMYIDATKVFGLPATL